MDHKATKTPEEMAAITAEINRQKQQALEKDALTNVKNGQIIMFVIAGLLLLEGVIYVFALDAEMEVLYITAPFAAIFTALGIYYYRDPYNMAVAGLTVYALLVLLSLAGDPSSIGKGIILKIIVITALVRAIKYGKDYKVAQSKNTGLLDDEFIS